MPLYTVRSFSAYIIRLHYPNLGHFIGTFTLPSEQTPKLFYSTTSTGTPFSFVLGEGKIIYPITD